MMYTKISVVLADDHDVVRTGIKTLLEKDKNIKVVGEAADGIQAVSLVRALEPRLLIIDNVMDNMNGLEAVRIVANAVPSCKIIVLTMYDEMPYVRRAFRYGASAYILKDDVQTELLEAVQAVLANDTYVSHKIRGDAARIWDVDEIDGGRYPLSSLTKREREIFFLVASGCQRAEMAQELGVSAKTIDSHYHRMKTKLGLKSRTQLVRFALLHELILEEQLQRKN